MRATSIKRILKEKSTYRISIALSPNSDIVKAHGGAIKVNIKENKGSEFIIQLSI